tara:strand:- start:188 stop:301 length:114 start_codon:yes stop_codon:yes gene_type:complete
MVVNMAKKTILVIDDNSAAPIAEKPIAQARICLMEQE